MKIKIHSVTLNSDLLFISYSSSFNLVTTILIIIIIIRSFFVVARERFALMDNPVKSQDGDINKKLD